MDPVNCDLHNHSSVRFKSGLEKDKLGESQAAQDILDKLSFYPELDNITTAAFNL